MGRSARQESKTGIHHIILRGINRQEIFEEEEDGWVFLRIIGETMTECLFMMFACCLMGNHIHMLVQETREGEDISRIMQRIASRFVVWYNKKYDRTGPLFQGRFLSEPVEDYAYFQMVFRYIHQNPLKAGMEQQMGSYRWNSFLLYQLANGMKAQNEAETLAWKIQLTSNDWYQNGKPLIDMELPTLLFGSLEALVDFCTSDNEDVCMEMYNHRKGKMEDEKAKRLIADISGCHNVSEFQALPRSRRKQYVAELLEMGMGHFQIRRLCGVSQHMVEKIAGSKKSADVRRALVNKPNDLGKWNDSDEPNDLGKWNDSDKPNDLGKRDNSDELQDPDKAIDPDEPIEPDKLIDLAG